MTNKKEVFPVIGLRLNPGTVEKIDELVIDINDSIKYASTNRSVVVERAIDYYHEKRLYLVEDKDELKDRHKVDSYIKDDVYKQIESVISYINEKNPGANSNMSVFIRRAIDVYLEEFIEDKYRKTEIDKSH